MRALEVHVDPRLRRDGGPRLARIRTESRWGLYHYRVDHPETNDADWFCHTLLFKDEHGQMSHRKRAIDPYVVPVDATEMTAYQSLRIPTAAAAE